MSAVKRMARKRRRRLRTGRNGAVADDPHTKSSTTAITPPIGAQCRTATVRLFNRPGKEPA